MIKMLKTEDALKYNIKGNNSFHLFSVCKLSRFSTLLYTNNQDVGCNIVLFVHSVYTSFLTSVWPVLMSYVERLHFILAGSGYESLPFSSYQLIPRGLQCSMLTS